MAADLHIHVVTDDLTPEHFQCFFANNLGSKYCMMTQQMKALNGEAPDYDSISRNGFSEEFDKEAWEKISETPNIWIGEVSWLKAALFEGGQEEYIPNTVAKIHEIIGEDQPIIDDKMIAEITEAFAEKNSTGYQLASFKEVWSFLQEHKGKKVFTISW